MDNVKFEGTDEGPNTTFEALEMVAQDIFGFIDGGLGLEEVPSHKLEEVRKKLYIIGKICFALGASSMAVQEIEGIRAMIEAMANPDALAGEVLDYLKHFLMAFPGTLMAIHGSALVNRSENLSTKKS